MNDLINREEALMCLTGEYLEGQEYKLDDEIHKFIKRMQNVPTVPAIRIPNNATNGEILCSIFPNMHYTLSEKTPRVITTIGVASSFDIDWWNAPYKGSYTECCGNCFFFNCDTTDTQPQFCDEKEEYVSPVYRCIKYRQRGETE